MDFKLDENLHPDSARLLREHGHDAVTVLEQGLRGCPDIGMADVCRNEERVLVTLDLDFSNIREFPPADHAGIIVLRLTNQSRRSVVTAIQRLLALIESEPLSGCLWIVDETSVRIRGQASGDSDET